VRNESYKNRYADSQAAIVDEAYLEYTADFMSRSVVSLVRDGANVIVFRTFDKIHALAGLPIGYMLAPSKDIQHLIGYMRDTMRDAPGVGLAAPQIGKLLQITVRRP
jgi:aspartate/methionine/tyrosine aminotransferase